MDLLLHICESALCNSVIKSLFFRFKIVPKNLDQSYKIDIDIWDRFRSGKTCHVSEEIYSRYSLG